MNGQNFVFIFSIDLSVSSSLVLLTYMMVSFPISFSSPATKKSKTDAGIHCSVITACLKKENEDAGFYQMTTHST